MILLIAVWLLQDLTQALAMGIVMVPEFFLLSVAYQAVSGSMSPERVSVLIWLSFGGGVLWDFRWVTFPGMSGLINALAVLAIYTVWDRTPLAGRSVPLFALLAGAAHFLSGVVHYMAWAVPGESAVRMFLVQQLLGVPALALLCMIMAFKESPARV